MITSLTFLTDDEVRRCLPADDEAGFGSLATERGHLPLKAMDVRARIEGLLGQVELRQTFANTLGAPLEATYIFPLPDRAAVTRFRMEVGGRVIEGVLQERGLARKEYEQAIQAGHRAAITEEERPNVFTLRVGNLMPGEEATVQLTMSGPLPFSDGEATFRFPLVVAPRYIPGTPLSGPSVGDGTVPDTDAVPDASRITPPVLLPGYPSPVHLSLEVDVSATGLPLGAFRSSLHAVLTEEEGEVRRIRLQPGERINRDFVLRFHLGDYQVRTSLVLKPDADGKEGTFALTLVPPADAAAAQRPRDVVFLLDRSGSMQGWKMVAARRALARMVDTLTDRDRFGVLAFDDRIETVPEFQGVGLVAADNRNRFRAVEFLARMEARGGTEMAQPLDLGVRQLAAAERGRDRVLVLVTDGQVGNEDQILRNLAPRVQDLRIFTLGIDRAVNEGFLQRLAVLGGGSSEIVESEDRLDAVMDRVHRRIGTPVLTGLRLEPAGLRIEPNTLVPARLPDLFAGAPLCILGRYRGSSTGGLALQARDAAGRAWTETVSGTASDNGAISSVWARGQVRALEDQFVTGRGDHAALEKRIVETSLRFGVLCRFTAFVAVDRSEVVNKGGAVQRITQLVEAPEGWGMPDCRMSTASIGPMAAACSPAPPAPRAYGKADGLGSMLGAQRGSSPGDAARGWLKDEESAPRAKSSGLFRGLFGGGSRQQQPPAVPPPPPLAALDLSAYRRRAQELLEDLRKQAGADAATRLAALGTLAGKLEALIEDLRSVRAEAADLQPLEELLRNLRAFLGGPQPGKAEFVAVRDAAEKVLVAFAGPVGRREGFWK
jgi:Ca-activated chloride channel family protein